MPVIISASPSLGLNSIIFVGKVSRKEALAAPSQIDVNASTTGLRWINVFDSNADLSDIDATALLELRERFRPLVSALAKRGEVKVVIVSNSYFNDTLRDCWTMIVGPDDDYPSNPQAAASLEEAIRLQGLQPDQAAVALCWLQAELEAARRSPAN